MNQIFELQQDIEYHQEQIQKLKEKLYKILDCNHEWRDVETGYGEYDRQCYKCLILESEWKEYLEKNE